MMEYGDIGIKDEDDVLLALKSGATAKELYSVYGERIAGLLASALDQVRPTITAHTARPDHRDLTVGALLKDLARLEFDTPLTVRIDVSQGEDDWERRAEGFELIEIMTDQAAGEAHESNACMFFGGYVDPAPTGTKDPGTLRSLLERGLQLRGKRGKQVDEWFDYATRFLNGNRP